MGLSSLEWLGARVTRQTGVAGPEQGKKVVGGGAVWQPVVVAQGPPHDGEERCWGVTGRKLKADSSGAAGGGEKRETGADRSPVERGRD